MVAGLKIGASNCALSCSPGAPLRSRQWPAYLVPAFVPGAVTSASARFILNASLVTTPRMNADMR